MNYFPIIIQIIFLFRSLPSLIPFSVPLLSVCPCLCAVSSQKFGISGAQALSVFYTAHCTMGQSPFLMKILYYFCNNNTLLTHIDIYSLFIFKLKEKCELPDILIKNILGRDACGFLFYFWSFLPQLQGALSRILQSLSFSLSLVGVWLALYQVLSPVPALFLESFLAFAGFLAVTFSTISIG